MKLTTIAAAAALAVASMSASAATYVPGTYTYKVNAHNAAMTIAVTVSKHRIEKIDWSKNLETIGVGRVALDIVSKKILDHQSVGVDAVTGATISSFALMQGVKDCLKQAKALGYQILQFNAVVASNVHAYHLYLRLGFTDLGIIPGGFKNKEGEYEDIHVMYRLLAGE